MRKAKIMRNFSLVFLSAAFVTTAAGAALNPAVQQIVDGVSEQRIAAIEQKLAAFGTRNTLSSQDDPQQGIGAARHWIMDQMKSFSPRLNVREECHEEKKKARITKDIQLCNVVAELKGTVHPERYVVVSGHYDSVVMIYKPNSQTEDLPAGVMDAEASAAALAPGVTDDASGVAAMMELARLMSTHEYEKSILFVAFAGEEQGLLGSRWMAEQAKKNSMQIEALLNNDIIGSDVAGNGRKEDSSVRVFADGPEDSGPRALARYTKEIAERYVPSMRVNLVFRADRFSRGGDHSPFASNGFAAVRLTSTEENYKNQHTPNDTFENTSPAYTTRVARMNAAVLATLALAPKPPVVTKTVTTAGAPPRIAPMIGRGKSGYDAVLKWTCDAPEADLTGFVILIRDTTSPVWQKQIDVGNVRQYVLTDMSIDDVVIGVKAIDRDGNESLASAYVAPPFQIGPVAPPAKAPAATPEATATKP